MVASRERFEQDDVPTAGSQANFGCLEGSTGKKYEYVTQIIASQVHNLPRINGIGTKARRKRSSLWFAECGLQGELRRTESSLPGNRFSFTF